MKKEKNSQRVFIAVMGVTGSGKSTFVQTASGMDNIEIGHNLHSCTAEVSTISFQHASYEITLIDTPGFNDTSRSETEVLKEIADWLDATYRNPPHVKLAGIIYLHTITDNRVFGSTLRNLKMFRKLCGDKPLKNVILATTCWNKITAEDLPHATAKEEELGTDPDFWQPMLKRGSRMARFTDRGSALDIILSLAQNMPLALQIQEELVDDAMPLVETAAGIAVDEELRKLEQEHLAHLADLACEREEALAAKDAEWQETIAHSTQALERQLDRVQREQETLRYERRNEQRRLQSDLEATKLAMARELNAEREKSTRERKQDRREYEAMITARRIEDEKHFEGIVAQLRANESKLRAEEREYLERRIQELERQPARSGRGSSLLTNVFAGLGNVGMSLLGFPMGGNALSGVVEGIFDEFFD